MDTFRTDHVGFAPAVLAAVLADIGIIVDPEPLQSMKIGIGEVAQFSLETLSPTDVVRVSGFAQTGGVPAINVNLSIQKFDGFLT